MYSSPSAVVFEQRFPKGADGTANNCTHAEATVLSAFPAFTLPTTTTPDGPQAYVQFAGRGVPTSRGCQMGPWPPNPEVASAHSCQSGGSLDPARPLSNRLSSGWEAAGAIAVFDGLANNTIVVSPHTSFTTTQAVHTEGVLSFGPRGSIERIPAGFQSGAIVLAGSGVGQTMRQWGLALMRKGGKDPDLWKADYSLKHLGYTTDNGAYYYYNTEDGKNYEDTILDLKRYTVKEKIPINWILYDSWFYSKAGGNATGNGMMSPSHAALNWSDADPAVFPSGLRYIYRATGWPVVAHARAWASAEEGNVYARADPTAWVESKDSTGEVIGLPVKSEFWDQLFDDAREWGCLQYQQDWMYTQASMDVVLKNATLSRLWHMQMTDALDRHGMRFGFGGVQPTDWLMSTQQQAVTNGRISNDYHANLRDAGAENWNIGTASIFGWALSVIPAKDGWWSTPTQPGHPYKDNRTENLGALHAAVATLSRGPVSPADKIGLFNRSQIMRSCMNDGTLLSPDRPALAIDSTLLYRALRGTALHNGTSVAYSSLDTTGATESWSLTCNWSQPQSGTFLYGNISSNDATYNTLADAQEFCCDQSSCGGVTHQSGKYMVRHGKIPEHCHSNCDGVISWVKNPVSPRPLQREAPNGELWSTYSIVDTRVYRHVLVPLNREPYSITPSELAANDGQDDGEDKSRYFVVENANSFAPSTAYPFNDQFSVPVCDRTDFKLYHTVPLLPNGWGLVGEMAKWVPITSTRIRSVTFSSGGGDPPVTLQLKGVAGEAISFGFIEEKSARGPGDATVSMQALPIHYVSCRFGPTGTLTMTPNGCV
eukprot:COSAG02_NODE_1040_length_15035_cov_198.613819_2_plen_825_part_00